MAAPDVNKIFEQGISTLKEILDNFDDTNKRIKQELEQIGDLEKVAKVVKLQAEAAKTIAGALSLLQKTDTGETQQSNEDIKNWLKK